MKKSNRLFAILMAGILTLGLCACKDEEGCIVVSVPGSVTDSISANTETEKTVADLKNSDVYKDYLSDGEYTSIVCNENTAIVTDNSVVVSEGSITITKAGAYALSGNFSGTVTVDAGKDDKVTIILNNVMVSSKNGPAIYAKKCDKLTVLLPEGSTNMLEDSKTYEDTSEDGPTGCLYSKNDLSIAGTGSLNISANYKDGIVSKDDLVITGGNYVIEAADDGVVGRDSLTITDGDFIITSKSHALKSSNEEKEDKGNAVIVGGNFEITSGKDGINVANSLTVENATVYIAADDDGIHVDKLITINSGKINITKSKEGIESLNVVINGGDITVVAKDDGININSAENFGFGGGFGFGGWNQNSSDSKTSDDNGDYCLTINGGTLKVNAGGDGLDSNSNIVMTGGYVFVSGPTDNANNATDYAGTFVVTGGTIIAIGTSGMYQSISEGSSCGSIDYIVSSSIKAGTLCSLKDGDKEILSFTTEKNSNAILIAGELIKAGAEYTFTCGDNSEKVTANAAGSYAGGFGGKGGLNGFGDRGGFGGKGDRGGFNGMTPPNGEGFPNDMTPPEGTELPEGMTPPEGFGNRKKSENNGL